MAKFNVEDCALMHSKDVKYFTREMKLFYKKVTAELSMKLLYRHITHCFTDTVFFVQRSNSLNIWKMVFQTMPSAIISNSAVAERITLVDLDVPEHEITKLIISLKGARSKLKCNIFLRKMLHGKIQTIKYGRT